MRLILALFPILLIAQDGFGYLVGFGSRLSGKNLLIIGAVLLILSRMVREARARIELPAIQLSFLVLIGYAALTWWIASFIVQYDRYPIWQNLVLLKILLIDYFLIFLAFFYGPRTEAEALFLLKVLLAVVGVSHVFTVGEGLRVLPTSFVAENYTGRMDGLIAQANQYGLFTAAFIAAFVAMGRDSRGVARAAWYLAAALSLASLALTFSRAAILGLVLGVGIWLYVFRRQISPVYVARAAVAITLIAVGIAAYLASTRYGDVIYERVTRDILQQQNLSELSAGRTDLWLAAIDTMAEQPVTFLTGFGWRVYWALPYLLAPHNTYLEVWFNLGLPGLFCWVAVFGLGLAAVLRAARRAGGVLRRHLNAAVLGILVVTIGLFFGEWYQPWPYFWAYFGLAMRLVMLTGAEQSGEGVPGEVAGVGSPRGSRIPMRDSFGWSRCQSQ